LRPLRACPVHTCVSPRTQVLIRVKAQSWTQPARPLVWYYQLDWFTRPTIPIRIVRRTTVACLGVM
jgi:hypothetical protein